MVLYLFGIRFSREYERPTDLGVEFTSEPTTTEWGPSFEEQTGALEVKSLSSTSYVFAMVVAAGLLVGGCSGGGGDSAGPTAPQEVFAPVTFEYQASTKIDPAVDFLTCTAKQVRFTAHLHFIWIDWEERRYFDRVSSSLFSYTAPVPAGRELNIALHDPNQCLEGDVYVAPDNLYANGALLSQVVDVAEGTGLSFRVESDGSVVP